MSFVANKGQKKKTFVASVNKNPLDGASCRAMCSASVVLVRKAATKELRPWLLDASALQRSIYELKRRKRFRWLYY